MELCGLTPFTGYGWANWKIQRFTEDSVAVPFVKQLPEWVGFYLMGHSICFESKS